MNVLGPANPQWERRRALIADELRRLDPDVVALQEVPCPPDLEVVHELLGPGYDVTPFGQVAEDGVGGVLATRGRHRVLEELDHRSVEREPALPWCATLIVEFETAVGTVLVAHHK